MNAKLAKALRKEIRSQYKDPRIQKHIYKEAKKQILRGKSV